MFENDSHKWETVDVKIHYTEPTLQAKIILMYVPKGMMRITSFVDLYMDSAMADCTARVPVPHASSEHLVYREVVLLQGLITREEIKHNFASTNQAEQFLRQKMTEFIHEVRAKAAEVSNYAEGDRFNV